jgi:hypothetical protein
MIYALHDAASGALRSWTRSAAGVPSAQRLAELGWAVKEIADGDPSGVWNPVTLTWDAAPPPPREITAYQFVLRFDPAKVVALQASQDPTVRYFMTLLDYAAKSGVMVDLDSERVAAGLQAAIDAGVLTEEDRAGALA